MSERKRKQQKTKQPSCDYIVKLQFENLVFERRIGK